MLSPEEIVGRTAFRDGPGREIQLVQTTYRCGLMTQMGISPGMAVLEIACGQGDMTAVLAAAVGTEGSVTAVDIADPDYGAPVTVGEAIAVLTASDLGAQIDARFQFNLLAPDTGFATDQFDVAVLVHGAWYFASADELEATLLRAGMWARRLIVVEWDMEPRRPDQMAHLLAVLIQGQVTLHDPESEANVRTPLSRAGLEAVIRRAGWTIDTSHPVVTHGMQDGSWEIDMAGEVGTRLEELQLDAGIRAWIASQLDVLHGLAAQQGRASLPAVMLTATRPGAIDQP